MARTLPRTARRFKARAREAALRAEQHFEQLFGILNAGTDLQPIHHHSGAHEGQHSELGCFLKAINKHDIAGFDGAPGVIVVFDLFCSALGGAMIREIEQPTSSNPHAASLDVISVYCH